MRWHRDGSGRSMPMPCCLVLEDGSRIALDTVLELEILGAGGARGVIPGIQAECRVASCFAASGPGGGRNLHKARIL